MTFAGMVGACCLGLLLGLMVGPAVSATGQPAVGVNPGRPACWSPWRAPVAAAVIDGYRPPSTRYGPGNRGLEYDTVGGEPVTAVASGDVTFAGQVGRSRFVVVGHGSGLRSTYAYLTQVAVVVGDRVSAGQLLATADAGFHLTARVHAEYRDPTPLLAGSCYRVRLVPVPPAAQVSPVQP